MKRYLVLLCTLLAVGIACCGCGDDKDNSETPDPQNYNSLIVGTWNLWPMGAPLDDGWEVRHVIEKDGTGYYQEIEGGQKNRYTWQLQNDLLILRGGGETMACSVRFNDADMMVWTHYESGGVYQEVLYRVK